jgi:hypothetical protein
LTLPTPSVSPIRSQEPLGERLRTLALLFLKLGYRGNGFVGLTEMEN